MSTKGLLVAALRRYGLALTKLEAIEEGGKPKTAEGYRARHALKLEIADWTNELVRKAGMQDNLTYVVDGMGYTLFRVAVVKWIQRAPLDAKEDEHGEFNYVESRRKIWFMGPWTFKKTVRVERLT